MLCSLLVRSALILALAGGGAVHAQAQTPTLTTAIMDANWNNANWLYTQAPVEQNIAVLTPLAKNNVIMAQWFLADALAQQGKDAEASVWLYSASMATRMDASLCRQKEAQSIEYRFLQTFAPQFARLRANQQNRTQALRSAIRFHGAHLQNSNQPDWVCRLVSHEVTRPAAKRPRPVRIPLVKQESWLGNRTRVYDEYKMQTGLDFSRTPDAIPITPVGTSSSQSR